MFRGDGERVNRWYFADGEGNANMPCDSLLDPGTRRSLGARDGPLAGLNVAATLRARANRLMLLAGFPKPAAAAVAEAATPPHLCFPSKAPVFPLPPSTFADS